MKLGNPKRRRAKAKTKHHHRASKPRRSNRRRARRRNSALVPASMTRAIRRSSRRRARRSRNPFGAGYGTLVKDGGVALVSAVITRAGPATLSSLTGLANSGFMGYAMNISFAALAAWAAESFLHAGYPAAIGGVVAIANRVVDDYTGVEVLDVNEFRQLTASGVPAQQAAAQATKVTPAQPTGQSGLGRFDRKWSLISGNYQRAVSSSFPPGTPPPQLRNQAVVPMRAQLSRPARNGARM